MKKIRKRRFKKGIKKILTIVALSIICYLFYIVFYSDFNITEVEYGNNIIEIKYTTDYKNIYCALTLKDKVPEFNDKVWIKGNNNICNLTVELNNTYNLFIRNNEKIISESSYNDLVYYNLNNIQDKFYIALNGTYTPPLDYLIIGNASSKLFSNYDDEIIYIKNNKIYGKSIGSTTLKIGNKNDSKTIDIIVTDLIAKVETNFDFNKGFLKCNQYNKENNDLLDNILKSRIADAGYTTRAGVVAAARFLTLELPYRIDYFYENGRIAFRSTKVDGEGRYYHIGLYLSQDRTSNIQYRSKGPATWGCSIYNNPAKRDMSNGLDCSGFVSWVLLNAGYNPGDLGAGITNVYDLTDTGEKKSLTYSLSNSDTIKAGDLLWKSAGGGHIAIIVGIDDENYYVAEALWDDYPEKGVIINTYSKANFHNNYKYVILMDNYYKNDGNYSKLWY